MSGRRRGGGAPWGTQARNGVSLVDGEVEHSISLRYQRLPTGKLEQEIIDDVGELIGERVDGRTALAASLAEAFASLLADDSSSGVAI
ncbi:hypothetical protein RJZ90_006887 [Blastomyces dermatitidis]